MAAKHCYKQRSAPVATRRARACSSSRSRQTAATSAIWEQGPGRRIGTNIRHRDRGQFTLRDGVLTLTPDHRPQSSTLRFLSGYTGGLRPRGARRHIVPSWVQHIGKEANRPKDAERADVQEWDEVLERYGPRGQGEWEIEVLPTLRAPGAERVAAAAGLSPREVYRILKSGRQPPPKDSRILTRVALAYLAMN